jgi:hypothetical protein
MMMGSLILCHWPVGAGSTRFEWIELEQQTPLTGRHSEPRLLVGTENKDFEIEVTP